MDAVKKVEELMQDEEFIGLYDKEQRDREERYAEIAYNKKLGREEGQEAMRKNVIKNMANHNMDISQIASIMNLNQSEVSKYLQA